MNSLYWRGPHYPCGRAEAKKLFPRQAENRVEFISQRGCQKDWKGEAVRLSQEVNPQVQTDSMAICFLGWYIYLITKFACLLLTA